MQDGCNYGEGVPSYGVVFLLRSAAGLRKKPNYTWSSLRWSISRSCCGMEFIHCRLAAACKRQSEVLDRHFRS